MTICAILDLIASFGYLAWGSQYVLHYLKVANVCPVRSMFERNNIREGKGIQLNLIDSHKPHAAYES